MSGFYGRAPGGGCGGAVRPQGKGGLSGRPGK